MLGGHTSEHLSGDSANAHSDETSLEDERAWTSSRLRLAAEADRALALAQAHAYEHPDWADMAVALGHLSAALRHDRANAAARRRAWVGNPPEPG